MTITVKHNKTNAIADWTQAQLDEQIALGNFAPGTTLANIVLPSDWNDDHTFTGTLDVGNGGTGATTLTGYVKGNGTSALTANATIPNTDISGLGTISTQNANNVAITGGSINGTTIGNSSPSTGAFTTLAASSTVSGTGFSNYLASPPTIGNTTPNTGKFTSVTTPSVTATTTDLTLSAISTGNINLNTPNGTAIKVLPVISAGSNWLQVGNPSTTAIRLGPAGSTVGDFRLLAPTFINFHTGSSADGLQDGSRQMRVSDTASAVNYVQVTGAATTLAPTISFQGSDTNIAGTISAKGAGTLSLATGGGTQARIGHTASAVNIIQFNGSATGNAIQVSAQALTSDTNISMAFQTKGTGAIDLAAGSSGVNISNGGTVTAITRTAAGSAYTSKPTVAITAPTTAGGVTALASVAQMQIASATIASGGTGYTVGDTLTIVGGTPVTTAATLTVSTVSAGVITGVSIAAFNNYTVLPTNPVSVTGGTGSGATFNLTYAVISFTIDNAGSGYIEQPTITFSGGGGSGAAAYATVGSTPKITSIGGLAEVWTASGRQLIIGQSTTTPTTVWSMYNDSFARSLLTGSGTTGISSGGANTLSFFTNSTAQQQLQIAHTASAVNYVQVTGAATGGRPVISTQGSDTNAGMNIQWKGQANMFFLSGNGSYTQFRILGTNLAVNNLTVTGTTAGSAPILSAEGTDTNIDLALTPKGTGRVKFGTYTASAGLVTTGYVEIVDAGGTIRRLAVV